MKIYTTEELDVAEIKFPYVEKQVVGDAEVLLYVNSFRSEDWYGYKGWLRKLKDRERAKSILSSSQQELLKRMHLGDTVFDCGANEGYITVLIAKKVGPEGRVVAFEPEHSNIEIMKKNLELNNITNVTIVEKAITDKSGDTVFFASEMVQQTPKGNPVETVCLDEYAGEKPAYIKIDVEGYELPVLKGAREILRQGAGVMIEMHLSEGTGIHMKKRYGFDPNDIITLMRENGYSMTYHGIEVQYNEEPKGCVYCAKEQA